MIIKNELKINKFGQRNLCGMSGVNFRRAREPTSDGKPRSKPKGIEAAHAMQATFKWEGNLGGFTRHFRRPTPQIRRAAFDPEIKVAGWQAAPDFR
jgi:hypothetical protein